MKRTVAAVFGGVVVLAVIGGVVAVGLLGSGGGSGEDPVTAQTPVPSPEDDQSPVSDPDPDSDSGSDDGESGDGEETAASASFDLTLVEVPDEAVAGEEATVVVEVANAGDAAGSQAIRLGNTSQSVELAAGGSETVELAWTAAEPGNRTVAVESANDTARASVVVLEPVASFEVQITGTNSPVSDREQLAVTANVTNTGGVGSTQRLNLTANGEVVNATRLSLASGESATRTVTWEPATPHGEYEVGVASANDTASAQAVVEPVEEPAVAGQVSVMNKTVPAEAGTVHLYEVRSGERVDSAELVPDGEFRFAGLDPGREYRLEIPDARGTHPAIDETVGGPDAFPTTEHTFTAASVQQSADLVYGYEIKGADSYRWEFYKDSREPNRYVGGGKYSFGEAYVVERLVSEYGEHSVKQVIYLTNKTFYNTTTTPAPVWYEQNETLHPPTTKPHRIVQNPNTEFIHLEREYVERSPVEQRIVHKYKLSGLQKYPDATVYIDPRTGYIVRWEAEHYHQLGPDEYLFNYPAEITFSDHNDETITVEAPR